MSLVRLSLALDATPDLLPDAGRIAVYLPGDPSDLSDLPRERVQVVHWMKPDHDRFSKAGFDAVQAAECDFAASIIFVPRAKALARGMVEEAMRLTGDGPVVVDGAKTDGIESILKECRKRGNVTDVISKAHGKIFTLRSGDFSDWALGVSDVHGWPLVSGVFSADGPDPASVLLRNSLPAKLGRRVADLGAGWGYLSAGILERDGVETVDLVEADARALGCAQNAISDVRAAFHWADALRWRPSAMLDSVVMNPPFHPSRTADPELGQRFIRAASGILAPSGRLWMVANRHLPYEDVLAQCFGKHEEIGGDRRFKVICAERPSRKPRR